MQPNRLVHPIDLAPTGQPMEPVIVHGALNGLPAVRFDMGPAQDSVLAPTGRQVDALAHDASRTSVAEEPTLEPAPEVISPPQDTKSSAQPAPYFNDYPGWRAELAAYGRYKRGDRDYEKQLQLLKARALAGNADTTEIDAKLANITTPGIFSRAVGRVVVAAAGTGKDRFVSPVTKRGVRRYQDRQRKKRLEDVQAYGQQLDADSSQSDTSAQRLRTPGDIGAYLAARSLTEVNARQLDTAERTKMSRLKVATTVAGGMALAAVAGWATWKGIEMQMHPPAKLANGLAEATDALPKPTAAGVQDNLPAPTPKAEHLFNLQDMGAHDTLWENMKEAGIQPGEVMKKLHAATAKAEEAGYKVEWHGSGTHEWVEIDGNSDPRHVARILEMLEEKSTK